MHRPNRRDFLERAGAVGLSAGTLLTRSVQAAETGASPKRPNILFFFPDQHRFDWLGTTSSVPVRTPHLDRLGRRGVRFDNAICPSPLCAPSRACLASGMEYDRCRVPSNSDNYPLDQTTFYRLLRDAGYHVTGCGKFDLAKAMHDWEVHGRRLLPEWGFSDGIDSEGKCDAIKSGAKTPKGPYMAYLKEQGLLDMHVADFRHRRPKSTFPTPLPERAYSDNWIARNGLDLIRRAPADKPWFLQINFTGPHAPWDVTRRMEKSCRAVAGFRQPHGSKEFDPATHLAIRQNYSAMVENIDRWLGLYLDELERRGELENTLVVYSSDHGEMLGDHNRWSKVIPYQPSVGVPLIVAGPGVRRGWQFAGPAATLDLTATFLDVAGVAVPEEMDSRSMKPLLAGQTDRHRDVVFSGLGNWRVAFDGRYKLVEPHSVAKRATARKQITKWTGGRRLFDLKNDPLENVDLIADKPKVAERLRQTMTTRG